MDRVLQFNFGYIPPKKSLAGGVALASINGKRSSVLEAAAAQKKARAAAVPPPAEESAFELRCVNYIRILAAEMVQQANSGHPGAAMGCAPMAHLLWAKVMSYNPADPKWPNRDRFVLSNGHACALLYCMLHLTGYDVSLDDLKQFRQLGSKTPGPPENTHTPGVEVATGPLGQGIANGVGMALGQAHMAGTFNRPGFDVVDNYTFVICGDGCLQEGVSSEASSLAGHLGLGRLIVLYDDNKIQIDGSTDLAFTEDVAKRYEAYGWQATTRASHRPNRALARAAPPGPVARRRPAARDRSQPLPPARWLQVLCVEHGDDDLRGLLTAIERAKAEEGKPTLIKVTTTIGFGSAKQGTEKVHGAPLGHADLDAVKKQFGFEEGAANVFKTPPDVGGVYSACTQAGAMRQKAWEAMCVRYAKAHPGLAAEFARRQAGKLPVNWKELLPRCPIRRSNPPGVPAPKPRPRHGVASLTLPRRPTPDGRRRTRRSRPASRAKSS